MRCLGFVLLAFGLLGLSACNYRSQNTDDFPSFEVPAVDEDREAFLKGFPLLNQQGEMLPPIAGDSGQWPLGTLVYMPPSGRGGFCSVSHISSGKVVANAHCVQADGRAYNYFVVFYDLNGRKTYDRVSAIEYQGNVYSDDVAALRLSRTDSRQWHVLRGKIFPTQHNVGQLPPTANDVTIWAFNPILDNHPELVAKYGGRPGMKFSPRSCSVSRTAPRVVGLTSDVEGNIVRRDPIYARAEEKLHLFVDSCSERMVRGNSGSLITDLNQPARVLGVYHWIVQPTTPYSLIEYQGNSGTTVVRTPEDIAMYGIFGVGTAFEAAFKSRPNLMNFFGSWNLQQHQ